MTQPARGYRCRVRNRFSSSTVDRNAAVLAALAVLGSAACKKENKGPPVVETRFLPPGPGCDVKKLPSGAVIFTSHAFRNETTRTFAVYPDGHIVASRWGTNSEVPEYPASIGAARVAQLEADLEATRVFEQPQGCWVRFVDGRELSPSPRTTIRKGDDGSWGYSTSAPDAPPSVLAADAIVQKFWTEVAHVVDREDASAPPGPARPRE
jgi:hypothetical protein